MGKISVTFQQLKKKNKKAFTVYVPFGFPTLALTKDILFTLQDTGVDVIELGIPFSDPLADGRILQEASEVAISQGATVEALFSLMSCMKGKLTTPVALMTYYNPVFRFGLEKFLQQAKRVGAGGIMMVDVPIQEAAGYIQESRALDLDTIFFITPVTPPQRACRIAAQSTGFIYYISVTGITGPRSLGVASIASHIARLKKTTSTAVCVGFGIHTHQQVVNLSRISDGVIVGSAVAKFIKAHYRRKGFLKSLARFIQKLKR